MTTIESQNAALALIKVRADNLIEYAEHLGVVLTIEQVPLDPLAMGNYTTLASVRPARGK